jgi:16S rRNA (uracil1498-N3)-methyltransferase
MQEYHFKNVEYFFSPPENIKGSTLIIYGSEYIHLTKVLRKKTDDEIIVVDGIGNIYNTSIKSIDRNSLECCINSTIKSNNEPAINISLAIALLKNPGKNRLHCRKNHGIRS